MRDPSGTFAGVSCHAGYINQQTTIRATAALAPFTPAVRDRFREAVGAR